MPTAIITARFSVLSCLHELLGRRLEVVGLLEIRDPSPAASLGSFVCALSLSLSPYLYVYICMCKSVNISLCIYIYTYTYTCALNKYKYIYIYIST